MSFMTDQGARWALKNIANLEAERCNGYMEYDESIGVIDVTLYYRVTPEEPKRRVDATFKLHKWTDKGAIEAMDPEIYN